MMALCACSSTSLSSLPKDGTAAVARANVAVRGKGVRPEVSGNPSITQSKTCNTDSNVTTLTCALANAVTTGDQTLVLIGSKLPSTITTGYTRVGTVTNTTSTIAVYDASTGLQSMTVTYSSASDVHIVLLEIANGGAPTGFASAKSGTAPSVTATANSIVFDMFSEQYGYAFGGNPVPAGWTDYYPPSPGNAGSGSNQLDSLAYVGAVAGTKYQLSDNTYVISASFQIPAGGATPSPSPTPSPTATPTTGPGGIASVKQVKTCNTDSGVTTLTCTLGSAVTSGDATLLLIGSTAPSTVTSGYMLVGTVTNSTSTISAYYDPTGLQSETTTYASATDVHVVLLEIASGGAPTGFSTAQSGTAPSITATANSIVFDMFGEQYGYAFGGSAVPTGWTDYYPPSPGNAGSGSNQLDSLAYIKATAGTKYQLSDNTYVISASFQIPSTASTPTPSPSPTGSAYDSLKKFTPPGGSFSYYPTSPYHATIPASPSLVSPTQSAAWNAMQASDDFSPITVSEDGTNVNDGSDPTTYTNGDGTGYLLECNKEGYSIYSCESSANVRDINNATVKFPLGVIESKMP
jgi:hypothetical protein